MSSVGLALERQALDALDEHARWRFESRGDLEDVRQREVSLASLYLAYIRKVKSAGDAELLLAPLEFLPALSDFVSEGYVGGTERTHSSKACLSRHQLSRDYKYQFQKPTWRFS